MDGNGNVGGGNVDRRGNIATSAAFMAVTLLGLSDDSPNAVLSLACRLCQLEELASSAS
jgi:hypothetical protein